MRADTDFEYFQTAPTKRILVRRGDPLGFRAVADSFADIVSPGLTNRTYDARWLSLLSWIMVRVEEARRQLNLNRGEVGLARQRAIYEWIRPLELMWVERAVRTLRDRKLLDRRQLPGRNALLRVVEANDDSEQFGMSADQFSRYRFTGPHGAYRSLLGRLPGMTVDSDGHRSGPLARRLAELVAAGAPSVRHPRPRKGRKPSPVAYWKDAWRGRHTRLQELERWLPGRWDAKPTLFADERRVVGPALFDGKGDPERRRIVAEAAVRSRAGAHADLCRDVVRALLSKIGCEEAARLAPLVPFTKLADAGVDAMIAVWRAAKNASDSPVIELGEVSKDRAVKAALDQLVRAGETWRRTAKIADTSLLVPVHALASEVIRNASPRTRLEVLLRHHLSRGGGRRWFRLEGDKVSPDAPTGGDGATPYRFRLWSLGRLAWQTGVVDGMPQAFEREDERGDEEPEGSEA